MISTVLPTENITTSVSDNTEVKTEKAQNLANVSFPEFFQNCRSKNDVNLNILNSELVTFKTNFYRHIPRKNFKMMSNSDGMSNYPQSKGVSFAPQKPQNSEVMRGKDSYVWDMWMRTPNTTPASTVLNSPDLTEIESKNQYQNQHQIKVGRSPVGHNESHNSLSSPSSPSQLALVADGEVVVFDDIEDSWHHNNIVASPVLSEEDRHHYKFQEEFDNYRYGQNYSDIRDTETASGNSKLTKMIGALPIAEYEGSPRRFGNIHHDSIQHKHQISKNVLSSPAFYSPRPGFPKRIILSPSDNSKILKEQSEETCRQNEKTDSNTVTENKEPTFDYLYEFSETRKVLEEFFKCPNDDKKFGDFNESDIGNFDIDNISDHLYIGQRLAKIPKEDFSTLESPRHFDSQGENYENNEIELYLDSGSRSSGELADTEMEHNTRRHSRNFTLSPETTDYDSNCGDLDSLSNDVNSGIPDFVKLYTSMPVLEDGLSSGHASDTENNNPLSIVLDIKNNKTSNKLIDNLEITIKPPVPGMAQRNDTLISKEQLKSFENSCCDVDYIKIDDENKDIYKTIKINDTDESTLCSRDVPTTPQEVPHRTDNLTHDIQAALIDIRSTLHRTKTLPINVVEQNNLVEVVESPNLTSPIWIPRREDSHESLDSDNPSKIVSMDDEEADTDLETDRLLGQQRLDDQGFYDEKNWCDRKLRTTIKSPSTSKSPQTHINFPSAAIRQVINSNMILSPDMTTICNISEINEDKEISQNQLPKSPSDSIKSKKDNDKKGKTRNKEGFRDPSVLIEGVLFRARYLGSTQLVCEGQPTKTTRMMQAEEAVSRIKAPEGETQPSTEVDLFISTEKIMVLNTDLKEIMMDHALRTISYIADIGDLVVLMARRRFVPQENDEAPKPNRTPKMICHVFESEEAQFIAQSIGQAFQVAYMEFLKANGIEDHSFVKEMDYQEVLNSQEIFGDELEIFAKKELQKEVVVPKAKGEILGVVIVESGWGSMLPTVVIANLLSSGAAARCGQLNIGDQIIAINGLSLVGLPLSTCQTYIRNTKTQTAVKFTVVPCPPVVEVKIKRPNTKYQLGFSVQNGVICSLLRGGIAERGGVRVGHRIIEINNQSVVAVPHEKIVNLLATSVGEILMKTMPTSMFRLLTGQENPVYI